MTVSGKAHFYQITNYLKSEAEAYSSARTQSGETFLHSRMISNGKNRKKKPTFAVFVLAEEKAFVRGKSKMMKFAELDKVEK